MIRWKDSIQLKVVGALVFVALLATIAAMLSSMALTRTFFTRYLDRNRYGRAEQLAEVLAAYYERAGSWQDVDRLLLGWSGHMGRSMMAPGRRMGQERLVLADERGVVIVDSFGRSLGETISKAQLTQGAEVTVDGRRRGTVFLMTSAEMALGNIEEEFLSSLRRSAWTVGAGVILVAALVGLILSKRLVGPLVTLAQATRRLAGRDLAYRVSVESGDEIGELAGAFNSMAAKLEETEELRRNMIADLAHELRTPITILRGNLESLQWQLQEATPELIISLHDEAVRLSRLVSDLQSLAVAEAGELKLTRERVDLDELVGSLSMVFTSEADAKGVDLQVDIDEDVPLIWADKDRLRQVLLNLLINALDHTPTGGRVGLRAYGKSTGVVLVVSDTGPGIEPEEIPRVFERYYRAPAQDPGGVGLGLAIAKAYVEAHGGRIWVESALGRGSSFYVELPEGAGDQ
ncbi:MAG: HAMP domain-containing protein [Firmicutes bacterium]|nr:HAMP domain-containing protein [Bacillota bacterium]